MLNYITCTGAGTFKGAALKEGARYSVREVGVETPTEKQNRLFHALCQEFYASGCHSYNVSSFAEFRKHIKHDYGAGFEKFVYVVYEVREGVGRLVPREFKKGESVTGRGVDGERLIPPFGILKSWRDYTKTERRETIDRLIAGMMTAGVNSAKFESIIAEAVAPPPQGDNNGRY